MSAGRQETGPRRRPMKKARSRVRSFEARPRMTMSRFASKRMHSWRQRTTLPSMAEPHRNSWARRKRTRRPRKLPREAAHGEGVGLGAGAHVVAREEGAPGGALLVNKVVEGRQADPQLGLGCELGALRPLDDDGEAERGEGHVDPRPPVPQPRLVLGLPGRRLGINPRGIHLLRPWGRAGLRMFRMRIESI